MAEVNKERSANSEGECVFCRIAQGKAKCYPVLEDRWTVTFLDQRPLFPGHCLLIPKKHIETALELPSALVKPVFAIALRIAKAVERAMEADGALIVVNNRVSQRIPHLHVHIVPRRKGDGLRGFLWPRRRYANEEEINEVLRKLRSAVALVQETRD